MPYLERALSIHAEQIAALLGAAFREFEALYTAEGFRATTPSSDEIIRRLADGPTWISVDGSTIVGTVSAVDRGAEVYIRSMAVLPAARGRRVATELLEVVHDYAATVGARRLTLNTTPFLSAAIRLYERTGFRQVPGTLDLGGTPLIAMVKQLDTFSSRPSPCGTNDL